MRLQLLLGKRARMTFAAIENGNLIVSFVLPLSQVTFTVYRKPRSQWP